MTFLNIELYTLIKDNFKNTDSSTWLLNTITILVILIGATKSFFELIWKILTFIYIKLKNKYELNPQIYFDIKTAKTKLHIGISQSKGKEFILIEKPKFYIEIENKLLYFYRAKGEYFEITDLPIVHETKINNKLDSHIYQYILSEEVMLFIQKNRKHDIILKATIRTNENKKTENIYFNLAKQIKNNSLLLMSVEFKKINESIDKHPINNEKITKKTKENAELMKYLNEEKI